MNAREQALLLSVEVEQGNDWLHLIQGHPANLGIDLRKMKFVSFSGQRSGKLSSIQRITVSDHSRVELRQTTYKLFKWVLGRRRLSQDRALVFKLQRWELNLDCHSWSRDWLSGRCVRLIRVLAGSLFSDRSRN